MINVNKKVIMIINKDFRRRYLLGQFENMNETQINDLFNKEINDKMRLIQEDLVAQYNIEFEKSSKTVKTNDFVAKRQTNVKIHNKINIFGKKNVENHVKNKFFQGGP